jgi:hypothetical protein
LAKATVGMPYQVGWAGFWDQDHHVWVESQGNELVDLSISQLHLHPRSTTTDEPIPPIWWSPANEWPPTMLYLPSGSVTPQLEGDEAKQLESLLAQLPEVQQRVIASCTEAEIRGQPILLGLDHLNQLASNGNMWAQKSGQVIAQKVPLPDWVKNRFFEIGGRLDQRNIQDSSIISPRGSTSADASA